MIWENFGNKAISSIQHGQMMCAIYKEIWLTASGLQSYAAPSQFLIIENTNKTLFKNTVMIT